MRNEIRGPPDGGPATRVSSTPSGPPTHGSTALNPRPALIRDWLFNFIRRCIGGITAYRGAAFSHRAWDMIYIGRCDHHHGAQLPSHRVFGCFPTSHGEPVWPHFQAGCVVGYLGCADVHFAAPGLLRTWLVYSFLLFTATSADLMPDAAEPARATSGRTSNHIRCAGARRGRRADRCSRLATRS